MRELRANGKLLLTGEYVVLDGARALALPTRPGQTLRVQVAEAAPSDFSWQSLDEHGVPWFAGRWSWPTLNQIAVSDASIAGYLEKLLRLAIAENPDWWETTQGVQVTTRLEFPRDWGLGSSSTLVSLLSQWSQVDAYALLAASFGGSGYDLACAVAPGPLLFERRADTPQSTPVIFTPSFVEQLLFVYLGKKQNSREGIARYRERKITHDPPIAAIDALTMDLLTCQDFDHFQELLLAHERLLEGFLDIPRVQEQYFRTYPGVVKSLGAWGGDFVLAASSQPLTAQRTYFEQQGYPTVLTYSELIRS